MKTIYKVTNTVNDKVYIGQTKNFKNRVKHHKSDYKRDGKRGDYPLYNDMKKFGIEKYSFEEIKTVEDSLGDETEEYYIEKYNSTIEGYNISAKANSFRDEKVMAKIRNKTYLENSKERSTKRNIENWKNKEYREKMSRNSSKVQKERLKDPKYLAEKSAQLKQYTDSIKKKVYQYDLDWNLIDVHEGTREAGRKLGLKSASSSISEVSRTEGKGRRKTYKGYHWRYYPIESVETIESERHL